MKTLKLYCHSNCQVCNTVSLSIVITLYIISLELTHLVTRSLFSLTKISPFLTPLAPGNHHCTLCFYEFEEEAVVYCRNGLDELIHWEEQFLGSVVFMQMWEWIQKSSNRPSVKYVPHNEFFTMHFPGYYVMKLCSFFSEHLVIVFSTAL